MSKPLAQKLAILSLAVLFLASIVVFFKRVSIDDKTQKAVVEQIEQTSSVQGSASSLPGKDHETPDRDELSKRRSPREELFDAAPKHLEEWVKLKQKSLLSKEEASRFQELSESNLEASFALLKSPDVETIAGDAARTLALEHIRSALRIADEMSEAVLLVQDFLGECRGTKAEQQKRSVMHSQLVDCAMVGIALASEQPNVWRRVQEQFGESFSELAQLVDRYKAFDNPL